MVKRNKNDYLLKKISFIFDMLAQGFKQKLPLVYKNITDNFCQSRKKENFVDRFNSVDKFVSLKH